MSLSTKDIKHIAQLARLTLTDKEINKYRREISGIVSYVEKLASVNVSKEEATTNLNINNNLLRSDSVTKWDEVEKDNTINLAPRKKGHLIVVPRIFEL